jgi:hypothetical protein
VTTQRLTGRLEAVETALQGLRLLASEVEFGRLLSRTRYGRTYVREFEGGCALTLVGPAGPLTYEIVGVEAGDLW